MLFYEVNANTLYSIAHDESMGVDERKKLMAQVLKMMAAGTPVTSDEAAQAAREIPKN
jgi:hypothetical protein